MSRTPLALTFVRCETSEVSSPLRLTHRRRGDRPTRRAGLDRWTGAHRVLSSHAETARSRRRSDTAPAFPHAPDRPFLLTVTFRRTHQDAFPGPGIHPARTVRFAGRPRPALASTRRPVQGHPRGFRSPPCRSGPDRQDYFSNDAAWDFRRGKDKSAGRG
jgi:hypothetical protein